MGHRNRGMQPVTSRLYLRPPSSICGWAFLLSLGGCHHRTETSTWQTEGRNDSPSALVSLYKGYNSGFTGTVREVVRDSDRWRAVWALSCCSRHEPTPFSEIDFSRYLVILAAGPRGVLGDSVVIDRVIETGGLLHVHVVAYQNCLPVQIVAEPIHLARIPRGGRESVFENEVVRGPNCI